MNNMRGFALRITKWWLSKLYHKRKIKTKNVIDRIVVIYRISDMGYPKDKPCYINNENCLRNAINAFPINKCLWYVIADNISETTCDMIKKYIPSHMIQRVSVGHGAGTFRLAYEHALTFNDCDCVYFLENDYLHHLDSYTILKEGLTSGYADYITLYDHPDKYGYSTGNFYIHGGENTKVFLTESCHWKYTNSTTMTFASKVSTLREDKNVFWRWTKTKHPFDFEIFLELKLFYRKKLISPLPGYSTHGETKMLSPLRNWMDVDNVC